MKRKYILLTFIALWLTAAVPFVSAATAVDIQWYGQSAFRIKTPGGKVIVIDPFITKNPKTPEGLKDLNKLKQVDLILLTHGHGDHIGDTARISKMYNAKVALNADMGHTFAALGWEAFAPLSRSLCGMRLLSCGISTVTVVPTPGEERRRILPPCNSTMLLTTARPSPAPRCFEPCERLSKRPKTLA